MEEWDTLNSVVCYSGYYIILHYITLYHIILYYITLYYFIVLHNTSNTVICTVLHFLMFLLELSLFFFFKKYFLYSLYAQSRRVLPHHHFTAMSQIKIIESLTATWAQSSRAAKQRLRRLNSAALSPLCAAPSWRSRAKGSPASARCCRWCWRSVARTTWCTK